MSIFDEFKADAITILAEIGRTVTFRGVSFSVIYAEPNFGEVLTTGGFSSSTSYQVKILRDDPLLAGNPPTTGEEMTIEGKPYTINAVVSRTSSAWFAVTVEPRDF
jgi:hypothetical protein